MEPYTVKVGGADYPREAIYTHMEGERSSSTRSTPMTSSTSRSRSSIRHPFERDGRSEDGVFRQGGSWWRLVRRVAILRRAIGPRGAGGDAA